MHHDDGIETAVFHPDGRMDIRQSRHRALLGCAGARWQATSARPALVE